MLLVDGTGTRAVTLRASFASGFVRTVVPSALPQRFPRRMRNPLPPFVPF